MNIQSLCCLNKSSPRPLQMWTQTKAMRGFLLCGWLKTLLSLNMSLTYKTQQQNSFGDLLKSYVNLIGMYCVQIKGFL